MPAAGPDPAAGRPSVSPAAGQIHPPRPLVIPVTSRPVGAVAPGSGTRPGPAGRRLPVLPGATDCQYRARRAMGLDPVGVAEVDDKVATLSAAVDVKFVQFESKMTSMLSSILAKLDPSPVVQPTGMFGGDRRRSGGRSVDAASQPFVCDVAAPQATCGVVPASLLPSPASRWSTSREESSEVPSCRRPWTLVGRPPRRS